MIVRWLPALLCLVACDIDRPWPTPEPSLERMVTQKRGQPYSASTWFADGKSMQAPPEGAVPYAPNGADASPPPFDAALLQAGRERFDTICATCHGVLGDGQSVVAEKMQLRKPPSLHEARIAALGDRDIYAVISEGYGLMPRYGGMLEPRERWAVIAYLRALQLSQSAKLETLPAALRAEAMEQLR